MVAWQVAIIDKHATDPRPLFLYASLHVIHNPIEAPADMLAGNMTTSQQNRISINIDGRFYMNTPPGVFLCLWLPAVN